MNRELALASGVAALVAVTWTVQTGWDRYDTSGPELLADGRFDRGLDGWDVHRYRGDARADDGVAVLTIGSPCEQPTCGAVIGQDAPLPEGGGTVVLGVESSTEGLAGPPTSVAELNVYLLPRGQDGAGLWEEVLTLVAQRGTTPAETAEGALEVQPHWAGLTVFAQLRGYEGTARIDDLTLKSGTPRATWRLAVDGLMGAWLTAGAATLDVLLRVPATRFRSAFFTACVAGLLLLLLPARYVDGAVDYAVTALRSEEEPPPAPIRAAQAAPAEAPAEPAPSAAEEPDVAALADEDASLRDVLREAAPHFSLFVVIAALGALAFPGVATAGLGVRLLAFAGTTEILQLFTADRGPAVEDLVADTAGLAVGIALARLVTLRTPRAPAPPSGA